VVGFLGHFVLAVLGVMSLLVAIVTRDILGVNCMEPSAIIVSSKT
jgi:hypothetical protein